MHFLIAFCSYVAFFTFTFLRFNMELYSLNNQKKKQSNKYLVLKTRYYRSGTLLTDNNSSKALFLPSLLISILLPYISGVKNENTS